MRKLIFILLVLLFIGCEKEDVHCWWCMTETYSLDSYSAFTFDVCGMTYNERTDFEKANTERYDEWYMVTTCKLDE